MKEPKCKIERLRTTGGDLHPDSIGFLVDNDPFPTLSHDPNSEVTFADGNVAWWWGNGVVTPKLAGTLHVVNGDDARFRVRVDSFDKDGKLVGTAYDDDRVAPHPYGFPQGHRGEHERGGGRERPQGACRAREAGHHRQVADQGRVRLPVLNTFTDSVTIRGSGIDVGGPDFSNGAARAPASVPWKIGDAGTLTATYSG
jgi:hypothetical protein